MIKVPLTIFEGGLLLKFIRIFHSDSAMWIYRQSFPLRPNARRFCHFLLGKDRSNLYEHHQKSLHLLQDRNFRLQAPDKFDHKSSECPVCQDLQELLQVRKAHPQFLCCAEYKYLHQNSWSAFPDAHHGEHHLRTQRQFRVFLLHLQVLFLLYRQSVYVLMDSAQPLQQDYPNAQQFFRCCQSGKYQMLPALRHLQNYKQSVRKLCRHLQMHECC